MNSDLTKRREYFADTGQLIYEEHRKVCRKPYKVDVASDFLRHIEKAVLDDKISPDALCGRAKRTGEFAVIVCTKTVYNYIDLGLIHIKSIDLPLRVRRNNKHHHCRQNRRILGESIENRPEPVNARQEFGHWEIDTVVGQRTAGEVLLTLDDGVVDESSEDDRKEEKILPNKKEYIERYGGADDAAPGWDAIDAALKKIYPNTAERHYGTIIKFMLGGKDPLDGISIYDNSEQEFHRHVVSYGMSELYYDPDSADKEFSGWGCEFTMRVVPFADDKDAENKDGSMAHNEPRWVINLMQNIARYVYDTGNYFEAYHFMPANSPIRLESDTKLVGIIMAPDPQLGGMDTVHGRVEFLQMVGVTQKELDWLCEEPTVARGKMLVDRMRQDNPLLLTDLKRVKEYV